MLEGLINYLAFGCGVNILEAGAALLPDLHGHAFAAVTDPLPDNAALGDRFRDHTADGVCEAFEVLCTGYQDLFHVHRTSGR